MPAKNSVKVYIEDGYYHLYNRGVEKRKIFLDRDDYVTFLHLLKLYLSPKGSDPQTSYPSRKNLSEQIQLLAYCLMPNHFHMLIKQRVKTGITDLMRCINTNYATYFNKKYERVGPLFQGKFKAVLVETDAYLLHLSRYIHLNPAGHAADFSEYDYSSYLDYLGKRKTEWVNPQLILDYFKQAKRPGSKDYLSYQAFIEDFALDSNEELGELVIDPD